MSLRNSNRNKIIYLVMAGIIVVVFFSMWFLRLPKHVLAPQVLKDFKTVQVGSAVINAELATTQAQQIQGLSGRAELATSTGMLFVFDRLDKWGIWMKDMNFPIDVIWISDDLKVNYIVENMLPSSYPKAYEPDALARYVLEVPVGTVKSNGIVVGQDVTVK